MTQIDQFEAVFRAAAKTRFNYENISIASILVIADLDDYQAHLFGDRLRTYLKVLGEDVAWHITKADECRTVGELLDMVEAKRPDLICTYRNVHSGGWRWPFSLGEHLDVLTQVTTTPVLVVPRPDADQQFLDATEDLNSVMAITDHLTNDDRLVNYAIRFTEKRGTLRLTHIESSHVFERYIDAISKIAAIDTTVAREEILRRLLKEPQDYIQSCIESMIEEDLQMNVKGDVTIGHRLKDYKDLVEEHRVDLLILNTKDDDQLAMHGLAHPLAIELRHTAILML